MLYRTLRTLLFLRAWRTCVSDHLPKGVIKGINEYTLTQYNCDLSYGDRYINMPSSKNICSCDESNYPWMFVGAIIAENLVSDLTVNHVYEVGAFGETSVICDQKKDVESNGVYWTWYVPPVNKYYFGFRNIRGATGPSLQIDYMAGAAGGREPKLIYPKAYSTFAKILGNTSFDVWCCPEVIPDPTNSPTPAPAPTIRPTPMPTRQRTPIPIGPMTPMPSRQTTPRGSTSPPTPMPTRQRTPIPIGPMTPMPSRQATPRGSTRPPTPMPTRRPRRTPPFGPTRPPTPTPTRKTTPTPTRRTTPIPTSRSSARGPTRQPTPMSTSSPTLKRIPTTAPDAQVTSLPTDVPTASITATPTVAPSYITASPSSTPTIVPSSTPSLDTTDPPVTSPADAPFTDPTGVPIRVSARKKRMTLSA